MSTSNNMLSPAAAFFTILVVALVLLLGWSYHKDGDFNPFNNDTIASVEIGDAELTIEE